MRRTITLRRNHGSGTVLSLLRGAAVYSGESPRLACRQAHHERACVACHNRSNSPTHPLIGLPGRLRAAVEDASRGIDTHVRSGRSVNSADGLEAPRTQ